LVAISETSFYCISEHFFDTFGESDININRISPCQLTFGPLYRTRCPAKHPPPAAQGSPISPP
jgi:hypothetical protein